MSKKPQILLSFDIEEFDVPREHGVDISLEEQIRISEEGTYAVLEVLRKYGIYATFFSTVNFAQHTPELLKLIRDEGHEIASHGYYHYTFKPEDLKKSKDALEAQLGVEIKGYRQARMMPVPEKEIALAGYKYNSSLHPTFIPGRYMHLDKPRTHFMLEGVLQIPTSVTPIVRFPLFWLSCHNLPFSIYRSLCRRTLRHDGYLVTYFHPWEFYELKRHPEFNLPFIVKNNSGSGMVKRLDNWICSFLKEGAEFVTFTTFMESLHK